PYGGVPNRDVHPVIAHHVTLRLATGTVGRVVDGIPVFGAIDEVYTRNLVLKQLCAAVMVAVSVRKEDVFYLTRIQTHLLQPVQNLILRGIVEQRLNDDNA